MRSPAVRSTTDPDARADAAGRWPSSSPPPATVPSALLRGKDMEALMTIAVGYGGGAAPAAVLRGRRRAAALHESGPRARSCSALGLQADTSPGRRTRRAAVPPHARQRLPHAGG